MTPSTPENFSQYEKLLVDLASATVDFAVVGGIAVSLNGFIRATDDVDILVQDSPDNLRQLLDCLSRWGEGWAKELSDEPWATGKEHTFRSVLGRHSGTTLRQRLPRHFHG